MRGYFLPRAHVRVQGVPRPACALVRDPRPQLPAHRVQRGERQLFLLLHDERHRIRAPLHHRCALLQDLAPHRVHAPGLGLLALDFHAVASGPGPRSHLSCGRAEHGAHLHRLGVAYGGVPLGGDVADGAGPTHLLPAPAPRHRHHVDALLRHLDHPGPLLPLWRSLELVWGHLGAHPGPRLRRGLPAQARHPRGAHALPQRAGQQAPGYARGG
mmetsp:Transcript_13812/g.40659  ORF Transcript_13812/g.40659 Transcript_13812/m.40659 type:complete len:214 (+) Transcript_13812:647-1288(+)